MISETNLENYFTLLASCNYTKAKRVMENVSVSNKHESNSNLSQILDTFMVLANMEKKYYSLEFLKNKKKSLFSRKESHVETYGDLLMKIKSVIVDHSKDNEYVEMIKATKLSLSQICDIRFRMTEMYFEISQIGKSDCRTILDLIDLVRPLKDYLKDLIDVTKDSKSNCISPLLLAIELEIDILMCLAEAQTLISDLYFLVPINLLHSANDKCQRLVQMCSSFSTSPKLFSRQSHSFQLHSWLMDFYNASLAKYTLYFHPILMQKMSHLPPDISTSYEGRALELIQRIAIFVKRASVSSFLLVFDATKQSYPFLGHGYVLHTGFGERLIGLQSYPVIFRCPMEPEMSQKLHCAIVMLIGRMINKIDYNNDEIEYLAEPDGKKTYFLARIDYRVYLILVFEERREREKSIVNFIDSIKTEINGKSIIDQLISMGT